MLRKKIGLTTFFLALLVGLAANADGYERVELERRAREFSQLANNFHNRAAAELRLHFMHPSCNNIVTLSGQLFSRAAGFREMAGRPRDFLEHELEGLRGSYFGIVEAAKSCPAMNPGLGNEMLALGNNLRMIGFYVSPDHGDWGEDHWRERHGGWCDPHFGWGHAGFRH